MKKNFPRGEFFDCNSSRAIAMMVLAFHSFRNRLVNRRIIMFSDCITVDQILETFKEEIAAHGGSAKETFRESRQLFVRAVLPVSEQIRPKDTVKSGVALWATDSEAWVYPYIFRLV